MVISQKKYRKALNVSRFTRRFTFCSSQKVGTTDFPPECRSVAGPDPGAEHGLRQPNLTDLYQMGKQAQVHQKAPEEDS